MKADTCIVGTGMGAIAAARLLVQAGVDVLFIEAGPLRATRRASPAIAIENVGRDFGIGTSRGLELGGGTAFWHGVCAPLDDADFMRRDWIPHSGWPIGRAQLARHYEAAWDFLCGQDGAARTLPLPAGANRFSADPLLEEKIYRHRTPPFRGKDQLRQWCAQGLARCVYNSAALRLAGRQGRAQTLVVGSHGRQFTVRAERFVIAAGALETPRLLLNSLCRTDAIHPDLPWWLGRNLIDHPAGYLSQVSFRQRKEREDGAPGAAVAAAGPLRSFPGLLLRPEVQAGQGLPNHAVFVRGGLSRRPVPSRVLMSFLGVRGPRDLALSHVTALLRHPYIVWRIAQQKLAPAWRSHWTPPYGDLFFMTEQLPNPASRVTLSDKLCDRHGYPVARVDWRLGEQDIAMFGRFHDLLLEQLGRHHEVHARRADALSVWHDTLSSAAHHLGTARMAATPADGVVDPDLKLFGVDNVWVSDGSVFPTAGSVNPSLTICALGHRLGAHLLGQERAALQSSAGQPASCALAQAAG